MVLQRAGAHALCAGSQALEPPLWRVILPSTAGPQRVRLRIARSNPLNIAWWVPLLQKSCFYILVFEVLGSHPDLLRGFWGSAWSDPRTCWGFLPNCSQYSPGSVACVPPPRPEFTLPRVGVLRREFGTLVMNSAPGSRAHLCLVLCPPRRHGLAVEGPVLGTV